MIRRDIKLIYFYFPSSSLCPWVNSLYRNLLTCNNIWTDFPLQLLDVHQATLLSDTFQCFLYFCTSPHSPHVLDTQMAINQILPNVTRTYLHLTISTLLFIQIGLYPNPYRNGREVFGLVLFFLSPKLRGNILSPNNWSIKNTEIPLGTQSVFKRWDSHFFRYQILTLLSSMINLTASFRIFAIPSNNTRINYSVLLYKA